MLQSDSDTSHELRGMTSTTMSTDINTNEGDRLIKGNKKMGNNDQGTSAVTVRTLSTFSGVICPVALSQFSTLLFLRLGFVVGQSGLLLTLAQFFLAYLILFLTIFSICAISTNGAVEGGGVYFMISRTLGPQIGGAIGVLFFLANICSCGLYVSGFVEGLMTNFGPGGRLANDVLPGGSYWWNFFYAFLVTLFCLCICLIGAGFFAKTSLFILMIVFVVIISCIATFIFQHPMQVMVPRENTLVYKNNSLNPNFTVYDNYTGIRSETFKKNFIFDSYRKDYDTKDKMNFIKVFAILFSSVTGIMNGANMSGELKRPSLSIPRGTIIGTVLTLLIYILLSFFTAGSCSRRLLLDNYAYMQGINLWPPFIFIGIVSTTLSAALGNLIGASRILLALARDELFGSLLNIAKWSWRGNPLASVIISFFLVMCVNLVGKLNYIAPIVSVCFLLSYASVNLACALLDVASPPNFRPTFKAFHWQGSLLGLIGCLVMTFMINPIYASVALILFLILIAGLHYRDFSISWGSISQALLFHQVRKYLLLLDSRKDHVKYWRPQMLLLVSNPKSAANLIHFVNDLKKGGLYVIGHVKEADFDQIPFDPLPMQSKHWQSMIDVLQVKAFVEMTIAPSIRQGVHHLIRISGLGGMKPNTICLGFYDEAVPIDTLARHRKLRDQIPDGYGTPTEEEPIGGHDNHVEIAISNENFLNDTPTTSSSPSRSVNDRAKHPAFLTHLAPLRSPTEAHSYDLIEYIATLRDIVKMGKSVCLARHFEQLDPTAMDNSNMFTVWFREKFQNISQRIYIDVWPVNFFLPRTVSYLDTTCLFMLQLACILHMVPGWKRRAHIRVFLCVDAHHEDANTIRTKMNCLLNELRIAGETVMVPWDDLVIDLEATGWTPDPLTSSILPGVPATDSEKAYMSSYKDGLPESYIKDVNSLIRNYSQNSAVCFCYLPRPPDAEEQWTAYHRDLTLLTDGLPPTILAHGLHVVTSTSL